MAMEGEARKGEKLLITDIQCKRNTCLQYWEKCKNYKVPTKWRDMFLVYSFNLLKKEKSKVIKKLTSMSIHSPLDKASSIAASTWPCKDSPTQHVGRNFTGNLWNLLFRNCLPSVIPRRDNASYSKQKKFYWSIYYCIEKELLISRENHS